MRRFAIQLALLALLILAGGCSSDGLVPVRGRVTLDGSPLEGATVAFTPTGAGLPARAITDATGRFELAVGSGKKGTRPGDYGVSILKLKSSLLSAEQARGFKPDRDQEVDQQPRDDNAVTLVEYLVPKRYASPASSGLTATVPAAGAEVTFELQRKLKAQ